MGTGELTAGVLPNLGGADVRKEERLMRGGEIVVGVIASDGRGRESDKWRDRSNRTKTSFRLVTKAPVIGSADLDAETGDLLAN